MKSFSLQFFGAALLIAATLTSSAQNTETRKVGDFHGVSTAGNFDVHIKIDGHESLKITGPADLLKEIETPVEDGVLQVRYRRDLYREHDHDKVEVEISAKALSSLSGAGAVKIEVDGALTGDKVKISTAGSGKIITGVKAGAFEASTAGSGDLSLKGNATSAKYSLAGSGKVNATDLKSEDVRISISGSGNAHVYADKTISASVAGSGSIRYSGNANITKFSSAGSGSISKENGE
jgi:hypothetical protein